MQLEDKFVQRIESDYQTVFAGWQECQSTQTQSIAAYFGDTNSNDLIYELADTSGAVALQEYADFCTESYFPITGEWIGIKGNIKDAESVKEANRLRELLNEEFINCKLYENLNSLIREGAAYKNAILNIDQGNGLSFDIVTREDVIVSKEKGDGNKRCYYKKYYTVAELIEQFQGDEVEELASALRDDRNVEAHMLSRTETVIVGVIPASEFFGTDVIAEQFKYVKLHFLVTGAGFKFLEHRTEGVTGFYTFPLINYRFNATKSLAELALPHAVNINRYEMQKSERIDNENRPTLVLDSETVMSNQYQTGPDGLIAVKSNNVMPQLLSVTGNSSLNRDDVQDGRMQIDRIFKLDQIRRTKNTSLSNYQLAGEIVAAMKSIATGTMDITSVGGDVLKRACHILERESDNMELKKLLGKYKNNLKSVGIQVAIDRHNKVNKLGRFIQTFAPYAQISPSARDIISGDNAGFLLAESMGLPEILASADEINTKRAAAADALERQQTQDAMKTEADVASKMPQEEQQ